MGANRCRGVRGLGEIVSLLLYFMFGSEHSVSRCVSWIGARHTFEPAARHLLTSHRTETMTTRQPYDLIVIGGGINGAGIARDAAGRGLSVLLCEADDFASHTSSASTKLIHGGLRYLEQYEFKLRSEERRVGKEGKK